jgi:hypothetical protein
MTDPQVQLFSVRLWSEDLGDGRREWRDQVCHASSGETRYFRDWPVLVAFLQEILPHSAMISSPKDLEEAECP